MAAEQYNEGTLSSKNFHIVKTVEKRMRNARTFVEEGTNADTKQELSRQPTNKSSNQQYHVHNRSIMSNGEQMPVHL